MPFQPVDPKQHLPEIEHKCIEHWRKNDIFNKSVEARKGAKKYVFFDGPPFANGLPHYGHIMANALKDAVTRYFNMKGFYVPRINGWDCHGLPVEYEVEKKLELSGRKDIEKMGVESFNAACRKSVFTYTEQWDELLERLARWVDMENRYATLDSTYMESIWWVFKQIWDKGLMYQGHKSMHVCPRCVTPLSNFEVSLGYKDVTDLSITSKFELEDEPGTYMLAWTTTPWSTISTMGLAAGTEIDYVKVLAEGGHYILAKKRVDAFFEEGSYKVLEEFKGKELLGKRYKHLFGETAELPEVKEVGTAFAVYDAPYVSDEDGTGLVTINGAFGDVDMESAQRHELPIVLNVSMDGVFDETVPEFAGKYAKTQDQNIAKYLEERGLLFKKENYRHSYPHCWRCDTALLNYATKAWFVRVTDLKDELIANNQQIHWQPEHIKDGRFGKWLENIRDWNISRNRFWGTPMPVWQCEQCEAQECIGGTEELKERAGNLPERDGELDLHKPYIDDITMPCQSCEGTMKRIPEVLDCWFESGAMPYAQLHYPFENKADFEHSFPADFIAEGLDQTRGWFYTLHVLSTILFGKPAFKNVIVNGILLAADGEKLSKRKKNYPDPNILFEQKGVDTVRMLLYTSTAALGGDVRFSEQHVEDLLKKFTLTLWNTYSFFVTYANIDDFEPSEDPGVPEHKLDQWILSRLNTLVVEVTDQMEDYNLMKATRPMLDFVDNLSNWYVRRSRRRFWKSENDGDKMQAYQTLYTVLVTFSKLLAPFMPFASEEIYRNLTGEESVHMADWPEVDESLINQALNEEVELARTIVTLGHAIRGREKIKVRQPLQKVSVGLPQSVNPEVIQLQEEVILEELNVKELEILDDAGDLAVQIAVPDARKLGPKYGKEVQNIIQLAKSGEFKALEDGRVKVGDYTLEADEVEVAFQGREGAPVESQAGIVVSLETQLTKELIQEGLMRDVVRHIQDMRKEAGYEVSDRILVLIRTEGELEAAITSFADIIKAETLADELQQGGDLEWDLEKEYTVGDQDAVFAIKKANS